MQYKNRNFYIESVSAANLVKKFGSPIYCYSKNRLVHNIEIFKQYFKSTSPLICFSVKSNSNSTLLRIIKSYGYGADVVSDGELKKVLSIGFDPSKIVYSGVGKKKLELDYAIKKNILLINVESLSELKNIIHLAKKNRKIVNVGLRLNPNIDAKTNSKISTGRLQDKFGLNEKEFLLIVKKYKHIKNINLKCLSVHIGSQIISNKPYNKMLKVIDNILKKSDHKFSYVDLGGGMGIDYLNNDKIIDYRVLSKNVYNFAYKNKCKIIFEPGRSIVGDTAILLTKIIYIKNSLNKKFIIIDAGMNDLIRPALYDAIHEILRIKKNRSTVLMEHDFVGPICETADRFLRKKKYQKLDEGESLAIKDVGAYGYALTSNYNLRPKPTEILIDKSKFKVISKKEKVQDLI